MNRSLGEVESLILGTVGLPGEREFYLQIKKGVIVSLALEKNQAASLAEKIVQIAREIGMSVRKQNVSLSNLEMPIEPDFSAGMIALTWLPNEARLRIEINAAEEESEDPKSISFEYEMSKAIEFALCALDVVAAGRQPCLFCGGPINVEGHLCPRANGYRRQI